MTQLEPSDNQDENAAAKACFGCADNAACEGFFGMLKRERANRRRQDSHADARTDIFDYVACF